MEIFLTSIIVCLTLIAFAKGVNGVIGGRLSDNYKATMGGLILLSLASLPITGLMMVWS